MPVSELWEEYYKTKSKEIRNKIASEYLNFVNYLSSRMMVSFPPGLEKEDINQYGFFGLIEAIENYDLKQGAKFETYAAMIIKGRIMDRVRDYGKKTGGPSRTSVKKTKMIEKATKDLEESLGRHPTSQEIADELDLELKQYYKMLGEINVSTQMSLDKMVGQEENLATIEVVKNVNSIEPEERFINEENNSLLAKSIEELPEKERLIVTFYYYEELTLKEIGMLLNLSESRISQIHTQAMIRLRNRMQGDE